MKETIVVLIVIIQSTFANAQTFLGESVVEEKQLGINTMNERCIEAQSIKIVREFLTAIRQGDHEQLAALLNMDVIWDQPGNNRLSGIKRSRDEVFRMSRLMSYLSAGTLQLSEVKLLAVNGNHVVCLLHWKAAQPTGAVLDVDNVDVYTVERDQIVQVSVYAANLAQEDKFWGK